MTVMSKLRISGNGTAPGSSLWMWCPGCDDTHRVTVGTADSWTWDGNETAPTISPSILVQWATSNKRTVCHSFLVTGVWQFLGDCTHALVGQHVPMVDLPDWLDDEYVV